MKKIIDLQTFQKITTDCMRVHETVRSTEPLTAEAERILQLADSLLREAGLAYLSEGQNLDLPGLPNSEQATPPEQVVENFIGVQHALVDLKQALYQLVKTYLAEQRWSELGTSINALISFGENGAEFSSIVKAIEDTLIPQAKELFNSKEWDEGRTLLKPLLVSPKVRSCYYTSYVDQSYALSDGHPLIELNRQLPVESHTDWLDDWLDKIIRSLSRGEPSFSGIVVRGSPSLLYPEARGEVSRIVMDPNFKPILVL